MRIAVSSSSFFTDPAPDDEAEMAAAEAKEEEEARAALIAICGFVAAVGASTGIIYHNLKARFWPRLVSAETARLGLEFLTSDWHSKPSYTRFPYSFDEVKKWQKTCCFSVLPCGCACARWADTLRIAGLGGYWLQFFALLILYVIYLYGQAWYFGVVPLLLVVVQRSRVRRLFTPNSHNHFDACSYGLCWAYAITQEAMCVEEAFACQHPDIMRNHGDNERVPFAQERMAG